MYTKKVFIDMQGFKSNSNEFIAKEVAVVFNNDEFINFIIKPPYNFNNLSPQKQKEAHWLTKNYHHLHWNAGSVSFSSVCRFLKTNLRYFKVYVKGVEKRQWLEKMMQRNIFNTEDIGCINLKQMNRKYPNNFHCNFHKYGGGVCALRNVLLLKNETEML